MPKTLEVKRNFENDEKWLITLKDGNGIRVE